MTQHLGRNLLLTAVAFGLSADAALAQVVRAMPPETAPPASKFEGQPAFSPDGRYLAVFVQSVWPEPAFRLLQPATLDFVNIPEPPGALGWKSHMVWSPTGERLLFAAATGSAFADLWVYDRGSNEFKRATGSTGSPGLWGRPKWSRDGKEILAAKQNIGEWAILSDEGVRPLPDMGLPKSDIADVAWGPTPGTFWVAVKSPKIEGKTDDALAGGVYLYTEATQKLEKRIPVGGVQQITPSPNGRLLACAATGDFGGFGASGGVRLLIVTANGDMVASLSEYIDDLAWSADGKRLVYRTQASLNVFDVDAKRFKVISGAGGRDTAVFLHPQTGRVWLTEGRNLFEIVDGRRELRYQLNDGGEHNLVVRDLNHDGRVDTLDYLIFERCFNGPGRPPRQGCPPGVDVDYDEDGDVDMADYAIFKDGIPEIHINGRGVPLDDRYVK